MGQSEIVEDLGPVTQAITREQMNFSLQNWEVPCTLELRAEAKRRREQVSLI